MEQQLKINGHEFEREQGGYMEGLGGKKRRNNILQSQIIFKNIFKQKYEQINKAN